MSFYIYSLFSFFSFFFLYLCDDGNFIKTCIDKEYIHNEAKNYTLIYNSSIPFSVHLVLATGNTNMKGIFPNNSLTESINYSIKINDRKLILTAKETNLSEYYLHIRCAACVYFVQFRQENHTNIIYLTHKITNYEFINLINDTTFYLPKTTAFFEYESQVIVSSLNCEFNLTNPNNFSIINQTFTTFYYQANNVSNISFKMIASKMYNPLETECKIAIDISHFNSTVNSTVFGTPVYSYHNFIFKDQYTPITFYFYAFAPRHLKYPVFDFSNEGLFEYGCEENISKNDLATTVTQNTFLTPRDGYYICKVKPLLDDVHFHKFSFFLKETSSYSIYFKHNQFFRDFTSFRVDSNFFTNIFEFTGKLVVYNPREYSKTCVRIREPTEKDEPAYWMINVNPDMLCSKAQFIYETYSAIETFAITLNDTEKCKNNGCELYLFIDLNVAVPEDEEKCYEKPDYNKTNKSDGPIEINRPKSYERGYYENLLFYLQKEGEITQAYFNEPIFGSFISENDTTPMYYSITVPFQLKTIIITFDRYKDYINLYINEGHDKPTEYNYDWKVTDIQETSLLLQYNSTEEEFGSFQDQVFTLMLLPKKYINYKSYFKVLFIPQYPLFPVQTNNIKLGESKSCNINNTEHLYCVFMLFLNKGISLNGWSFYIDFPHEHNLQTDSIYVRTLPFDLVPQNVYTYLDNNIERLFPDDSTSHTVKLGKGEQVYYSDSNSLESPRLVLVKVNVPKPTKVKMYTTKYYNRTSVNSTYFSDNFYYYVIPNKKIYMAIRLVKGITTEIRKVSSSSAIIYSNETSLNVLHNDTNCVRISGSIEQTINLTIDNTNLTRGFGLLISSYEEQLHHHEFLDLNLRQKLYFNENNISSRSVFYLLSKGKNYNIHLHIQNDKNVSLILEKELNITAHLLNMSEYNSFMQTQSLNYTYTTCITIDYSLNSSYGFLHFTSSSKEINYIYITIQPKKQNSSAFNLFIIKQEENMLPPYFIQTIQPIQGCITNNTKLSTPLIMKYPLKIASIKKLMINITSDINIRDYLEFINVTDHPSHNSMINGEWFIKNKEILSNKISLDIIDGHPEQLVLILGFVFHEHKDIKYVISLDIKDPTKSIILSVFGIVILVIIIAFFIVLLFKRKKRSRKHKKYKNMNFLVEDRTTKAINNITEGLGFYLKPTIGDT